MIKFIDIFRDRLSFATTIRTIIQGAPIFVLPLTLLTATAVAQAPLTFGPVLTADLSGQGIRDLAVVDLTGDGLDELVLALNGWASGDASISVIIGNGIGDIQDDSNFTSIAPAGLGIGDFDEDGELDLVVATSGGPGARLRVLIGDGSGDFGFPQLISVPSSASALLDIAVADFNGDAHLDFAAANAFNGETLLVYLGAGDGTFSGPVPDPVSHFSIPHRINAADLDLDGDVDIVLDTGQVLINAGDASFTIAPSSPFAGAQALGDFNGDGIPDTAAVGSRLFISLGNGDGTFAPVIQFQLTIADGPAEVVDLNGDGILDIMAVAEAAGAVALFLGNGDGTFQPEQLVAFPEPRAVAALDLNGDGLLDLAAPFGAVGNADNDLLARRLQIAGPPAGSFADSCSGDGGNQLGCTNCPCMNNAPAGTIGGCLNSAGTSTRIAASGDLSASLPPGATTDLRFTLTGAPAGALCVMTSGDAVAPQNMGNMCFGLSSGVQSADRDGLRCAVTNTRRHGGRSASAFGEVINSSGPSRVWGGEAQPGGGLWKQGGFVAGQTRYFQVTYREDPLAVCGRGLNTSQAVEIVFEP